jgi:probable phosphoglycerate mutase
MRHAAVAYFGPDGTPVDPVEVPLTEEGLAQAQAAAELLGGIAFDRVLTSGLPRALQTARIVVPGAEPEVWPELAEIRGGRIRDIPEEDLEAAFTHVFDGVVPPETRFLGGETIGSLVDRVVPAVERLGAEPGWSTALAVLHAAVNRAILSFALTGERRFLGAIEQAPACVNVLDVGETWVVRAVNTVPYDLAHEASELTTMEELFRQYRPLA